jgi:hypothetical protein
MRMRIKIRAIQRYRKRIRRKQSNIFKNIRSMCNKRYVNLILDFNKRVFDNDI